MGGQTAAGGPALVLVRATSPFLPNAVLAQREASSLALAATVATDTELIARVSDAGGGPVERLRDRAVECHASALVTWSAFGLVATSAELAIVAALIAAGTPLYEAHSGQLAVATEQRLAQMLPSRPSSASAETQRHSLRTREGRHAVARQGGWLGGRCPLGWIVDENGDAALDMAAAGRIRTATNQVSAGTKIGAVVAQWNATGFTTSTGRQWTFGSTRRVLLRARNAGLVEYRGNIVGRSSWPAIVTVREWTSVRRQLTSRPNQEIA